MRIYSSILLMKSDLKWCIHLDLFSIIQPFHSLGKCHCWWTRESLRAHAAKFYRRLELIRSVSRASTFYVLKFIEIVIFGVYSASLWLQFVLALLWYLFSTFLATLFAYGSLMMVQYSKCANGSYYYASFHIVKARPLHSIPCEVFAKCTPKAHFSF